jgi:hypothetical protein
MRIPRESLKNSRKFDARGVHPSYARVRRPLSLDYAPRFAEAGLNQASNRRFGTLAESDRPTETNHCRVLRQKTGAIFSIGKGHRSKIACANLPQSGKVAICLTSSNRVGLTFSMRQ